MQLPFDKILLRPDEYLQHPDEVLDHPEWTLEQKITLLSNWKATVIEMLESDNENMLDEMPNHHENLPGLLQGINHALEQIAPH